jgi:RNA polymerase sigma-70 factor (ECF subfamily)
VRSRPRPTESLCPLDPYAELESVQKIRAGDEQAFEQLFRAYCQPLIDFVRSYVRDTSLAESLVQDVFLAIWSKRSQLDPALNIKTYLFTAARNQALNHLRHSDVERRSAEDVALSFSLQKTPDDDLRGKEIALAVDRAVQALPEKTRTVFSMNRFSHLTYAEIAQIQDVSIKTVETQMGRALKSLRDHLAHLL